MTVENRPEREWAGRYSSRLISPDLAAAFACYQKGDFEAALSIYAGILSRMEQWGRAAQTILMSLDFYRDRCRNLLARQRSGELDGRDGVYDFSVK